MTDAQLLVCIANEGADDLQVMKIYRRLSDAGAAGHGLVRVIDDSGEDFLYPEALFRPLPAAFERELGVAERSPARS